MTGQFGISETLDALDFGLALIIDTEEFLKDKNILDFKDSIFLFVQAISGADKIFPELSDLQEDELQQIHDKIAKKLPNILPEKSLELANIALNIVTSLVKAFALKKSITGA